MTKNQKDEQDRLKAWYRSKPVRKHRESKVKVSFRLSQTGNVTAILSKRHWTKDKEIVIGGKEWKAGKYAEYHQLIVTEGYNYFREIVSSIYHWEYDMRMTGKWD